MTLRYPSDGYSGDADYVSFRHMKYTSRKGGGRGGGGGGILLYMPEVLPDISNRNIWGKVSFGEGAKGTLARNVMDVAGMMEGIDLTEGMSEGAKAKGIERIKSAFDKGIVDNAQPLGKQIVLDMAASALPLSANQALSVQQGRIYNPNVELAYGGPEFRSFAFRFRMVPKSAGESQTINNIIKEFKTWSAPQLQEGGMYEIPHVWMVNYMSGGGENQFQNTFKPAALMGVTVQDNSSLGYYSAHQGGAPIETALTLSFQEVDVITRDDHSGSRGM